MNQELKKEIEEIIKKLNLQCSVKDFPSIVDWYRISKYQKLSESFIEKFKDRLDIAKIPKENIIYQKENDIQDNCKRNTCYNCKQPTEVLNTGLRNIMKWCPQCKV